MDANGHTPRSRLPIIAAAVLASLATAMVLGAVLLFIERDDNAPIQILLPTPPVAEGSADSGAGHGEAELRVDIIGAVLAPGVYTLRSGARLEDAIAVAGGLAADADPAAINKARRLRDEEHYHIPVVGESPPAVAVPAGGQTLRQDCTPTDDGGGLIDLNSAAANALQTLPGLGQVRADDIVSYREQRGPFRSIDEVTSVTGIGPATYEKVRNLITVCNGR